MFKPKDGIADGLRLRVPPSYRRDWSTPGSLQRSAQVDGEALEIGQRAVGERAFMGGAERHLRCGAGLERLGPARRTKAPAVARLHSRKTVFRHRRGEIVTAAGREFQELRRGHDANG